MAASAISNLLRKNVGAGLARVSLNKNIIRNYFSLLFSVDKRAFKRRVWFDFKPQAHVRPKRCDGRASIGCDWSHAIDVRDFPRTCMRSFHDAGP